MSGVRQVKNGRETGKLLMAALLRYVLITGLHCVDIQGGAEPLWAKAWPHWEFVIESLSLRVCHWLVGRVWL